MNNTKHYFGAYLEIKVKQIQRIETVHKCDNGHEGRLGMFCQECGKQIKEMQETIEYYPTYIVDSLLDEEWEDVLSEITPPSLYGTGVILAVSNMFGTHDDWLIVDRWSDKPETKQFPTMEEIEAMRASIVEANAKIIQALINSPHVISVDVKAGYVLDMEY